MARRPRQVYFEMQRVGKYVRVVAIDSVSGVEVTMVGDPSQGTATLKRLAARKLDYVLEKKFPTKKAT